MSVHALYKRETKLLPCSTRNIGAVHDLICYVKVVIMKV